MNFESVPQPIRVDIAKTLAQKGVKALPEGWSDGRAAVPPKKLEKALHYLDVALAVHEDATVRGWRASCLALMNVRRGKKAVDLDAIPEDIRFAIGGVITMRGMRTLPQQWVDEKDGVGADKLQTAIHYLDVALAVDTDITAMNWRAQCLALLHRWDDALVAFAAIADLAKRESNAPYLEVAEEGAAACKAAKKKESKTANKPPSKTANKKVTRSAPVVDPKYVELVTSFLEALVKDDFATARGFLSKKLKSATSEKALAKVWKGLAPGRSSIEDFDVVETAETWTGKKPGDVGWAYAALHSQKVEEGVAVTVGRDGAGLAIRALEWGRP